MKKLLMVGLLLLASPAEGAKVIQNDPGGFLDDYLVKAERLRGQEVRLRGFCSSACTFYLRRDFGIKVCAERGAVLKFHMPFQMRGGLGGRVRRSEQAARLAEAEWKEMFLGRFNKKLNMILASATRRGLVPSAAAGASNKKMFVVEATRVLPLCKRR